MRQAQSALRSLRADQAKREKAEAALHPPTMERAGYWFRDVSVPAPDEGRGPAPDAPPPPARTEPPAPALGEGRGVDIVAEAEQYALIYPERAARIRALGGLPRPCDFGPPSPELVHAIVTGTSPILRALDKQPTLEAVAP